MNAQPPPRLHAVLQVCADLDINVLWVTQGDFPDCLPSGEAGWEYLDDEDIRTVFAVRMGTFIDATSFVPGQVAIHQANLDAWVAGCPPKQPYPPEVFLLHEVAHAVVGLDEDLATVWERDVGRQLFSDRVLRDLRCYSGSDPYDLRKLRKTLKLRPGWALRMRPQACSRAHTTMEVPRV